MNAWSECCTRISPKTVVLSAWSHQLQKFDLKCVNEQITHESGHDIRSELHIDRPSRVRPQTLLQDWTGAQPGGYVAQNGNTEAIPLRSHL